MNKKFATAAAKPATPPPPRDTIVKGFFGIMKTSSPDFLARMIDQYPGLLEAKGSPTGGTPLVYAAEMGKLDLVKMLHKKGANLLATGNGDQGALFYAGLHGWQDVAAYLIGEGVDPAVKNSAGMSPIDATRDKDIEFFGKQMQTMRAQYLAEQEEIARLKAVADQQALDENVRQITANVRNGVSGIISAPEKASFRRKA